MLIDYSCNFKILVLFYWEFAVGHLLFLKRGLYLLVIKGFIKKYICAGVLLSLGLVTGCGKKGNLVPYKQIQKQKIKSQSKTVKKQHKTVQE